MSILFLFLFWLRCNAKFVSGFQLFSREQDGRLISNFYRFVSLCVWWITLSAYTAINCFVSKNQFCNVPFALKGKQENTFENLFNHYLHLAKAPKNLQKQSYEVIANKAVSKLTTTPVAGMSLNFVLK